MNSGNPKPENEGEPGEGKKEPLREKALPTKNGEEVLRKFQFRNYGLEIQPMQSALEREKRQNLAGRQKLILAEMLSVIAEFLDPKGGPLAKKEAGIKTELATVEKAINEGIGQMLKTLRPTEKLVHEMMLWHDNSRWRDQKALEEKILTVVLAPKILDSEAFQSLIRSEIKSTNDRMGLEEARQFIFMPFDALDANVNALIPYLRIANKYCCHVVGALSIANSRSERERLQREWSLKASLVDDEEREILSQATAVVNELVIRDPILKYGETAELTASTHTAFAAGITRYMDRVPEGNWAVPIRHRDLRPENMRTVNMVDTRDDYKKWNLNGFIFAYTTTERQDRMEPGGRHYGRPTMFPRAAVGHAGNYEVPLWDFHARITKNRIRNYVALMCERHLGDSQAKKRVREKLDEYLGNLAQTQQIDKNYVIEVEKDKKGEVSVNLTIVWNAMAGKFTIRYVRQPEQSAAA